MYTYHGGWLEGWLLDPATNHSVPGWTLPPAVDLIAEAANGFDGAFGDFQQEVRQRCSDSKRNTTQAAASAVLLPLLYPCDFPSQFARRLALWVDQEELPADPVDRIGRTLQHSCTLKPSFRLSLAKLWCNAIPTSFRTHSPVRTCVFGCSTEQDRISHYIRCPRANSFICQNAATPVLTVLALPPTETDPITIRDIVTDTHIRVEAIQQLLSGRFSSAAAVCNETRRRAMMLRAVMLSADGHP